MATQPHNHTTTQPHNHTTTQPQNSACVRACVSRACVRAEFRLRNGAMRTHSPNQALQEMPHAGHIISLFGGGGRGEGGRSGETPEGGGFPPHTTLIEFFFNQIMLLFKLGSLVKWCFLFAHTMENSISLYVIFFLHF